MFSPVRHRAQEIVDLVSDTDRLKEERVKARSNRNKYTGMSNSTPKYAGFGSESVNSGGFAGMNIPSHFHPPTSLNGRLQLHKCSWNHKVQLK